MDLRAYYQKIRNVEGSIKDASTVVISLESADGGKAGVMTEVLRSVAARMIVDASVRPATEAETTDFRGRNQEALRAAQEKEAASRVQVRLLSVNDLKAIQGGKAARE